MNGPDFLLKTRHEDKTKRARCRRNWGETKTGGRSEVVEFSATPADRQPKLQMKFSGLKN